VIGWLDESCKQWGRCTRWIIASSNKFGDPEGYPSANTLAKAREGMLSFGSGVGGPRSQHFDEVRLEESLIIARAMPLAPHMPITLTAHLWAQYVVEGRASAKLPALSRYLGEVITVAEYWRNVDRAHYFHSGRIAAPSQPAVAGAPCSAPGGVNGRFGTELGWLKAPDWLA
jgi:hypothetical protein